MMMARYLFICALLMLVDPCLGSSSKEATAEKVDTEDEKAVDKNDSKDDASTKDEDEEEDKSDDKDKEDKADGKDDDEELAKHEKKDEKESSDKDEGSAEDEDASTEEDEEENAAPSKKEKAASKDEEAEGKQKEKEPASNTEDLVQRLKDAQLALEEADKAIATVRHAMDADPAEEDAEADSKEKDSSKDDSGAKADDADDSEAKADDEDDSGGGMDYTLIKEVTIPIVAFAIGAVLHQRESTAVYGKLAMFFGAQTVMNLYMKQVLSGSLVDEEEGLKGIPSAFIVTALQQLVAFIFFGIIILILLPTPYAYKPKQLTSKMEWLAVVLFSFSFTMNIALNNFSISLLPLSVNLIIRSCLPLATFITQRTASKCTNEPVKDARIIEILFMVLGVGCAVVAVIAKSHVASKEGGETKTLAFGIIVCVASLFSGAINLALAGVLGTSCKLNSLDTTVYMSIPAFLFLIPPSLFYWHPVSWPGWESATDREIFMVVLHKKPSVIGLAAFSGVLAFFYNVFQYGIVHSLSASYTAFAGNFNKAATIALGIIVGLEALPPGFWGIVMVCACIGNIAAFTAFNIVKMQAKPEDQKPKEGEGEEKKELIGENKA